MASTPVNVPPPPPELTAMLAEMVSSEVAPTEFSYALVMEGYAQHGAVENILTLIQQVEGRGMAVNRRMISVLMEAYIARSAPPSSLLTLPLVTLRLSGLSSPSLPPSPSFLSSLAPSHVQL